MPQGDSLCLGGRGSGGCHPGDLMIFMTFFVGLTTLWASRGDLRGVGLCWDETSAVGRLPVSGGACQAMVVSLVT